MAKASWPNLKIRSVGRPDPNLMLKCQKLPSEREMTAERQVTKGKVSEDVGFSPGEAAIHAMRVDIAVEIEKFIKRKKMTLAAAAKFFGVPQDRIRKILKGGYGRLSVEFLIKLVCKTGKIPSITFAEEID